MWKEKYNQICTLSELFGEKVNGGANDKEIESLICKANIVLGVDIPTQYLDVLKKFNGLEFNGFIIYGIDTDLLDNKPCQVVNGLIDNNKVWYENPWLKKYIFLGDSNISWYAYDIEQSLYCELSKPAGDVLNSYSNVNSLIDKILGDAL